MSLQRRRGEVIQLFRSREVTNRRGDPQRQADLESPIRTVGKVGHERSAEASLPGQLVTSNDYILVPMNAETVQLDAFGAAYVRDRWWDFDGPPVEVGGSRHTKHLKFSIRLRPGPP